MDMMLLPALHPLITVYPADPDERGLAQWTLHHRITNQYYRISALTYAILKQWQPAITPNKLVDAVKHDTGEQVTIDDLANLMHFLHREGFLIGNQTPSTQSISSQSMAGWIWWLKNYLFFTLPLLNPDQLLHKIYPFARGLFSPAMLWGIAAALILGFFLVLPRIDEFTHSILPFMSWSGAIALPLVFIGIKLVHESAHALACTHYRLPVPHMGIAFMLLIPLPYTETSAMWRLSDRRARAVIGSAGILAELAIGACALILWSMMPQGSTGQSITAAVVLISLAGSLVINGNPLMRFDGYYVLSDYLGIDNLQDRSIAHARWALRKCLIGLHDSAPESLPSSRQRFLVAFGICLLVYRFFLFLGIALLVYHLFPKPFGLFLMCVELGWFIIRPLCHELAELWKRHNDFRGTRPFRYLMAAMVLVIVWLVIPIPTRLMLPAVMGGGDARTLSAPAASTLVHWQARDGVAYAQGTVLAVLQSDLLEKELALRSIRIQQLTEEIRQLSAGQAAPERASLQDQLQIVQQEKEALETQQNELIIRAPYDGVVRDADPLLKEGDTIAAGTILFRFVNPAYFSLNVYAHGDARRLLMPNISGDVYIDTGGVMYPVASVAVDDRHWQSGSPLPDAMIASVHGGPINSRPDPNGHPSRMIPSEHIDYARLTSSVPKGYGRNLTLYQEQIVTISLPRALEPPIAGMARDVWAFLQAHATLNPDR